MVAENKAKSSKSADRGTDPGIQRLSPEDEKLLIHKLGDPIWRISNLYTIVDKNGKRVRFTPNEQQQKVLVDCFVNGYRRQVILKARQLGMSTLIEIVLLDQALFNNDTSCAIIADTAENAKLLLENKVKFAYDNLFQDYKRGAGHLTFSKTRITLENGSSIIAGVRTRGTTNQVVHISEWGKVAHTDPKRSREIKTGTLPTCPIGGIVFIESTFEGGKGGEFYTLLKMAMETKPEDMTDLDFYFQFFPWWEDENYSLDGNFDQIPEESIAYFKELESEESIFLTNGQRLWYYKMAETQGDEMKREYPSTPEEAFNVPVKGAIHGPQISKIRAKQQIINFEVDTSFPIMTFWDIGFDDYTTIWFIQVIGPWIYVVDHFRAHGESASFYADILRDKGWRYSKHFLPHDAKHKRANVGKSFEDMLNLAGVRNTEVLPQPGEKWTGINQLNKLIPKMFFHLKRTATDTKDGDTGEEVPSGVTCLECYHRRWLDAEMQWHKEPVHDWSSHDADGLRSFAEAYLNDLIDPHSVVGTQHKPKTKNTQVKSAYRANSQRRRKRTPRYR